MSRFPVRVALLVDGPPVFFFSGWRRGFSLVAVRRGLLRGGAALGRGVAWWAKVTFSYGTLALWLLVAWWLSAGLLALLVAVGWLC